MILSAVVTLLTSQLQVYVASGVTADSIRASELCSKTQCLDGTAIHDKFFPASQLRGWDFDGFTAGPIDGWPKALDDAWRATTAKCRAVTGPQPWKPNTQLAAGACGEHASKELWSAWLAHSKATQVAVFKVSRSERGEALSVRSYKFPATEARLAEVSLADNTLEQALKQLAVTAANVSGTAESLVLPPRDESKTQFTGEVVSTAVAGVKRCDGAPSLLEVSGADPLAKSVSTRWSASKVGKAQGRSCTLSVTKTTATLTCGEVVVSSEVGALAKNSVESLSGKLVKSLADRLCR